jgi:hypothetical protein
LVEKFSTLESSLSTILELVKKKVPNLASWERSAKKEGIKELMN